MAPITTKTSSGTLFPDRRYAAKITKVHSNFRHAHRAPAKQEHNRLVATLLATPPNHMSTKQQWTTYLASHSHTKALKTCAYQISTFGAEITVSRWWDGNHSARTAGLLAQASVSNVPSMQLLVRRCTKIHIRLTLAGLKPLDRFYEDDDVALIEETVKMALRPVDRLVQQCRRAEEVTVEVDGKDGLTTSIAAEALGDLWADEDPRITVARVRRSEIPPVCAGHFGRRVRRNVGEGPVHRGLHGRERGETESEKRIRKWLDEVEHEVVMIEDDEDEAEIKVEEAEESDEEINDGEGEYEKEEYEEEEFEEEIDEEEGYEEPRPGMMNNGVYYVRKGGELIVM
ncbi:hypothetical protein B0A48_00952 [Cryoendolithus antarcticus]|uniref:Uncharacterized protein n=1 Tax=Cryoendolithus antarcticus TaxID=1507870 RepID=A0A1V8TRU4_9PEZI|nr:hypothetical protein B0A48_00952 [Cryoendolithus antarcticus]